MRVWDGQVYTTVCTVDYQQDLLYGTENSDQYYMEAWVGGECGGEWMQVYVGVNSWSW